MKMFNKVAAPFAGTVKKILLTGGDGSIVAKGDPIFEIEPDEVLVLEDEGEISERRRTITLELLGQVQS